MGNSGQRQCLQRIGRHRHLRRQGTLHAAVGKLSLRRGRRRRPIRCKNCRCPELPTCPEFPPFTLYCISAGAIELAGKLLLHHNRTGEVVFITKKNYTLLSSTVIAVFGTLSVPAQMVHRERVYERDKKGKRKDLGTRL